MCYEYCTKASLEHGTQINRPNKKNVMTFLFYLLNSAASLDEQKRLVPWCINHCALTHHLGISSAFQLPASLTKPLLL